MVNHQAPLSAPSIRGIHSRRTWKTGQPIYWAFAELID